MSSSIQPKTDQLAAALAPHLGTASTSTLKGVAKSLRQLAKQLTNQQTKQEKAAAKAARPTGKVQRNLLAGKLLADLHPHLALSKADGNKAPKKVANTVQLLAAQLLKQQAKLDRKTAKAARKTAKAASKATKKAAAAKPTPAPAPRASRPPAKPAARKPAPTKVTGAARVAKAAPVPQDGMAK